MASRGVRQFSFFVALALLILSCSSILRAKLPTGDGKAAHFGGTYKGGERAQTIHVAPSASKACPWQISDVTVAGGSASATGKAS